MAEPLLFPQRGAAFIPLNKCLGGNFNGLHPKIVEYKGEEYLLVKYGIDLCQRLAKIGVRIPGPIRYFYDWPGEYIPYNHQAVTSDFMTQNLRSFCFNEIGTGKTLSAIWAADFLMNLGVIHKVLIICTLSTLDRVWTKEIAHSVIHRSSEVVYGGPIRRAKKLAEDVDFYIVNHDGLRSIASYLADRPDIDHVIMDEGAVFRNSRAKTLWPYADAIINNQHPRGCWWVTGAPMPKAPTDLWAQARIVNKSTVPKFFTRFRDMTMHRITQYKWVPVRGWEDIAYSTIQPSIRFTRDESLPDLPECIVPPCQVVPMSKEQEVAYKDFKDHFVAEFDGKIVSAVNEGSQRTKMLQIAAGAIYHPDRSFTVINADPKLDELSRWVEESNRKLIIYVPFTHGLEVVGTHLNKKFPKISVEKLWGQVGKTRRNEVFEAFQDGDLNVILAHPEVMAHGLTMTATNVIVWWSAFDDYDIYHQANGRIQRISQSRKQYIIRLACCKKEVEVYRRLEAKESMQGILLDMIDN